MVITNMLQNESKIKRGDIANSIVGRTSIIVIYTLCFSATFCALLFFENNMFSPAILKFTLLVSIAFVSGLLSRQLLSKHEFWIQFSISFFSYLINLWMLFLISSGYIGIDISEGAIHSSIVDETLQIILGGVIIWKVLIVWKAKATTEPVAVIPQEKSIPKTPITNKPIINRQKIKKQKPKISSKRTKIEIIKKEKNISKKQNLLFKIRLPKKNIVQLSKDVEYCCPYCLETVMENDIRGTKTCKVCKTPHHADCWEVTGMCQIPHL
jgi:hypothetical protein